MKIISLFILLTFINSAEVIRIKTDWADRVKQSEDLIKGAVID